LLKMGIASTLIAECFGLISHAMQYGPQATLAADIAVSAAITLAATAALHDYSRADISDESATRADGRRSRRVRLTSQESAWGARLQGFLGSTLTASVAVPVPGTATGAVNVVPGRLLAFRGAHFGNVLAVAGCGLAHTPCVAHHALRRPGFPKDLESVTVLRLAGVGEASGSGT